MAEERLLDTKAAIPLVAGAMLGVGIFLVPAQIAPHMPSAAVMYGLWIAIGLFCWTGALCYAELGVRFPRIGGDVVYIRELYGHKVASVLGWVIFAGIFTGSIAALAVPLCQFQLTALFQNSELINWSAVYFGFEIKSILACFVVIILTVINMLGLRLSTLVQALLTFIPMGIYGVIALTTLLMMEPVEATGYDGTSTPISMGGIAIAISGCYFAFSGWNQAGYVAGEMSRPSQTLPRTVTYSVWSITILYLLLNMAFVHHLGFEYLQQVGFAEVGTLTAKRIGGDGWGWWMNLLILLGLVGSLNGTILCGARVGCSMAKEGGLYSWFAKYSNTNQPVRVLFFQAIISIVYILTGTFEQLLELVSLAMILVAVVTATGVWHKDNHQLPQYKVNPIAPYIFVFGGAVMSLIMIYHTISDQNWAALFGGIGIIFALFLSKFFTEKVI
ncbi:MAG: APC family permease [Myxococcota bacterium]